MHKLEVQVSGTLTVDASSKIDVSAKGYLGGNPVGRTTGNTTVGGATGWTCACRCRWRRATPLPAALCGSPCKGLHYAAQGGSGTLSFFPKRAGLSETPRSA
jgi:hypothetical protein